MEIDEGGYTKMLITLIVQARIWNVHKQVGRVAADVPKQGIHFRIFVFQC